VALIKQMARGNRLWGAERIWGELLKLGIRVCKRTIQKYMRGVRTTRPRGQTWRAFIHIHAQQIWACDFLPVTDLFFRSLFAFFIIELHSRKVIHVGVTRSPTDAWTAQQLRETTAYDVGPKYLIRDNDSKFGVAFDRVAKTSGIEMLKTPITPREPMPAVSGFWAVSGVSASITCSSCRRGNSTASSRRMWPTSTKHDPIKGSGSRSLTPLEHLVSLRKQEPRWLPFRSSPVCTMSIEGWLKAEATAPTMQDRSGLVISCRSPICSFDRSLPSSSPSWSHARWSMSGSHARRPMPGWPNTCEKPPPYGQAPKYLVRDNDSKFGSCFTRVVMTSRIELLKTPYHASRANAICERFLRSVRQECLDHLLIVQERQFQRVLIGYVAYFNQAWPHQGIGQQIPEASRSALPSHHAGEKVIALPVVGGLYHDYRWAA
jgi:hypothetical protein